MSPWNLSMCFPLLVLGREQGNEPEIGSKMGGAPTPKWDPLVFDNTPTYPVLPLCEASQSQETARRLASLDAEH